MAPATARSPTKPLKGKSGSDRDPRTLDRSTQSSLRACSIGRTLPALGSGCNTAVSNCLDAQPRIRLVRHSNSASALSRSEIRTASSEVLTAPYLSRSRLSSGCLSSALSGGRPCGGAWARLRDGVCPRTPSLTSVLDPGWLRVGYMMCDGVFQQMVWRPLILSGLFPGRGRQERVGSWPRFIG